MNVLVDMYILVLARSMGGSVCISGVGVSCFPTLFGHCEGLKEREDQLDSTLLILCSILKMCSNKKWIFLD